MIEELIKSALVVEYKIIDKKIDTIYDEEVHVVINARLGNEDDDDVEWAAFGVIYALSGLSFTDARPRGASEMHFDTLDDWTLEDMLRHISFVRGELHFYADYVKGRMMKTRIDVRKDGTFTLETTNRGEAATRWISRLQGKQPLAVVGE